MFSKHYDDGSIDNRFSQNGNYSVANLLQEKNPKTHLQQKQ